VAVAAEPLVGRDVVDGAPPRAGGQIRVLDLTRVIAGPVCTRLLGVLGADVLRIDPPHRPDLPAGAPADSLLAKRSAVVDLRQDPGRATLRELLASADVVVSGYRPGSLDDFGLSPGELATAHPGLVVVLLDAWGHSGPWATRRGFDSVVQAPTGIAVGESRDGATPGTLPCQLLDHGTGYLAAAAALDGLRHQRAEGGTHVRRLSLARTASWLTSRTSPEPGPGERIPPPESFAAAVGTEVSAIPPPGFIGGRALRWPSVGRYGAAPARWL
jgi:crotonobetainyl-CoA:carnitine CoA-transferase CaiB-like acyl-CoA transferase